jgi:poly(A) polymerase
VNGLLLDPLSDELLDFVGGRRDIEDKIIRTIGPPAERFQEDKLRMIRAVRFATNFQFHLDPTTKHAIKNQSSTLGVVSRERVRDELIRILTEGNSAAGIKLLEECELLREILPEVSDLQGVSQPPEFHPEGDVWVHTLLMLRIMDTTRRDLQNTEKTQADNLSEQLILGDRLRTAYPTPSLAWGVLLHDIGKPETFQVSDRIRFNNHAEVGARLASRICDRLRLTSRETERIVRLVQDHLKFKDLPNMKLSTLKRFLRQEGFDEHLELHRLDCLGSHRNLTLWRKAFDDVLALEPDEIRPPRFINGDDLISLGYDRGPIFSRILKAVEDAQLDGTLHSRQEALEWVEANFAKPVNPFESTRGPIED